MTHHVLTIAQQKGGAGKTTIAAHLAVALSQRGLRVAVVDIDPQGSLTRWHQIREEKLGEGFTGMTFSHVSGWRVGTEITRLKRRHDLILIDSPPHTETEAKTAIRNADMVVVPVQPSPTDLWATQATVELANHERVPLMMILNRVSHNAKIGKKIADQLEGLAQTRIGNRVAFATALMEGRCVTETAPSSPAAQEIKSLTQEIWDKLGLDEEDEALEEASEVA